MKKITALSILSTLVMALGIVTFSSCGKDDACKNVTCVNGTLTTVGSTCSCTCAAGAFGTGCSKTYSGLFLSSSGGAATWRITNESTPTGAVTYTNADMVFTASSSDNVTLNITNFYGAGTGVSKSLTVSDSTGTLTSGTDTIRFTLGSDDYKIYNYAGHLLVSGGVSYTYQITVGGTTETATGTLVKQ